MEAIFTKKQLLDALEGYEDTDTVKIEVFDTVAHEDLYAFYFDPIHMGEDSRDGSDRGHELRLTLIPHEQLGEFTNVLNKTVK